MSHQQKEVVVTIPSGSGRLHNLPHNLCFYREHQCMISWWRHQMKKKSALQTLCVGNSPVTGEFPSQKPVTRSFGVFFDLRLNEGLSKQSLGWWFETSLRPLWRHCNNCVRHQDRWALNYLQNASYENARHQFICIYIHIGIWNSYTTMFI